MPEWNVVTDIEPAQRARRLPDGRMMQESRITVTKEAMEMLWQGYLCAACLEDLRPYGAFPDSCPTCGFEVKTQQRARLEEDFVGEVEEMRASGWIDQEQARLEEEFHIKQPQIHVRRDL